MPGIKKEQIPAKFRWDVWERDDFTCRYCGRRRYLQVDHVIPESQGGPTELDNLVTLCGKCNQRKGARTHDEYEKRVCLQWAARHIVSEVHIPRYRPIPDSVLVDMRQHAEVMQLVRFNPDDFAFLSNRPNPQTGLPDGDFVVLRNATAKHFVEIIDDRRALGRHNEADRFTAMAVEKHGPNFRTDALKAD